jgi:hypothetical protein
MMSLLSRWRVSMDTARPTNRPSIDRCVPQALFYRSASLSRNLSACGVLGRCSAATRRSRSSWRNEFVDGPTPQSFVNIQMW